MRQGYATQELEQFMTQRMLERDLNPTASEAQAVEASRLPVTQAMLERDIRALGVEPGMVLLVHCSLSRLGWVCGGAQAVISALVNVLTPDGTIVMPAFTSWNTDPAEWRNPPVPQEWHQTIREELPPYIAQISPSRGMGQVAELFRSLPGVQRSAHPVVSVCAWGRRSAELVASHPLDCQLGEESPLGTMYAMDGQVLSLGVRHNSTLHLSEYIGRWEGKQRRKYGCAMLVEGQRRWMEYEDLDLDDSDFPTIKNDFEQDTEHTRHGSVGEADCRLVRIRAIVDYGAWWMEQNRRRPQAGQAAQAAAG